MADSPLNPTDLPPALRGWLGTAVELGASDLHLVPGYPPVVRLNGDLVELPGDATLDADEVGPVLLALCSPEAAARLATQKDADLSFEATLNGKVHRFRVNLFHTGRELAACLRLIPSAIP